MDSDENPANSRGAAFDARRADQLFDYPLPIPTDTAYQQIGIEPDATDDDIRVAVAVSRRRIETEKRRAYAELQAVFEQLPELKRAYEELDLAREGSQQLVAADLRNTQAAIAQLERKAISVQPRFLELREQTSSLDRRILDLNRLSLEKPAERLAYDSAHPPLALFKLTSCTRDEALIDRRTSLALLRADLSGFLEAQGEAVFHPSDLTRTDFSGDFASTPLLDGAGA